MTNTRIEVDGLVLADFVDVITDNNVDHDYATEVVEKIDAEEIAIYDRGNGRTSISLFVVRTFNSLTDAENYRTMVDKLPRVGKLLIKTTQNYDGTEKRWYMNTPCVKVKFNQALGVTTFAEFSILGGIFRNIKPATVPGT